MKYLKTFEQKDKSQIEFLDLSYKNLTKLPDLSKYTNLKSLHCYNNQLTSLSELPKTLKYLSCHDNQLTSLPILPDSLRDLDCEDNKLKSLPELPNKLERLYCNNNKLKSLPELPNTLISLYCDNNHLPFNDLTDYKEWYEQNKDIIETEGLDYAYEFYNQINKYNI